MTPTSDERREVVARLREVDAKYIEDPDDIAQALAVCVTPETSYNFADFPPALFTRLADLIDPTCHDFGGEEGTNGEGYDFACSACGYVCDLAEPRFCPNCGRRCVG